jgi:hypothetical protein
MRGLELDDATSTSSSSAVSHVYRHVSAELGRLCFSPASWTFFAENWEGSAFTCLDGLVSLYSFCSVQDFVFRWCVAVWLYI